MHSSLNPNLGAWRLSLVPRFWGGRRKYLYFRTFAVPRHQPDFLTNSAYPCLIIPKAPPLNLSLESSPVCLRSSTFFPSPVLPYFRTCTNTRSPFLDFPRPAQKPSLFFYLLPSTHLQNQSNPDIHPNRQLSPSFPV